MGEGEVEMTGPRPAGRPWTRAEDDQMRAMFEAGVKAPAIGRKIKRTVSAVRTRKAVLDKRESGTEGEAEMTGAPMCSSDCGPFTVNLHSEQALADSVFDARERAL